MIQFAPRGRSSAPSFQRKITVDCQGWNVTEPHSMRSSCWNWKGTGDSFFETAPRKRVISLLPIQAVFSPRPSFFQFSFILDDRCELPRTGILGQRRAYKNVVLELNASDGIDHVARNRIESLASMRMNQVGCGLFVKSLKIGNGNDPYAAHDWPHCFPLCDEMNNAVVVQ
jgi:hypothetical protein